MSPSCAIPYNMTKYALLEEQRRPTPNDHSPQPMSELDLDLTRLKHRVLGANLGASALHPRSWGHRTIGDLLNFERTTLPKDQVDRGTMADPQPLADRLHYAAAVAIRDLHANELTEFWCHGQHVHARLWRELVARDMKPHRRTQVRPALAKGARGGVHRHLTVSDAYTVLLCRHA